MFLIQIYRCGRGLVFLGGNISILKPWWECRETPGPPFFSINIITESPLSQSNFKPLSDRSNKVTFHWLWRWNAHLFHQSNSVFSKFKDQLLLWAGAWAFTRLPIDDIIPYFFHLNTVHAAIYLYWYLINKTDFLFSFKRLLQQHTLVLYYK